jgi:PTH1 family peptidyl-tRNA hydrolase
MDPAAFVLSNFSAAERKELPVDIARAADAVEVLIAQGLERAQQDYNT